MRAALDVWLRGSAASRLSPFADSKFCLEPACRGQLRTCRLKNGHVISLETGESISAVKLL